MFSFLLCNFTQQARDLSQNSTISSRFLSKFVQAGTVRARCQRLLPIDSKLLVEPFVELLTACASADEVIMHSLFCNFNVSQDSILICKEAQFCPSID